MELSCYNSYYEVDLGGILENYERIRRYIAPVEVIPVIKANAYGMGTVEVARAMAERGGCPVLACAQVFEGLSIREAGILSPEILIIGPVADATIPHAVRNDLQIPLYTPQGVSALSAEATRQGKHVRAQIKIETGMIRMGARPGEELEQLLSTLAQCPNIEITGAYTHFVQAEIAGDEVTRQQFQRFHTFISARVVNYRYVKLSFHKVKCRNYLRNKMCRADKINVVSTFFLQFEKNFAEPLLTYHLPEIFGRNFIVLTEYTLQAAPRKKYRSRTVLTR